MITSTLGTLLSTQVGGASIVGLPGQIQTIEVSGTGTRSSDGLSWSSTSLASGCYALAGGSGTFVAVVNNNGTLNTNGASYSVDGGQTWIGVTGLTGRWTDAAYSPTLNRFVIVRTNDVAPKANYVAYNDGGRGSWVAATGPTGVGTGTFMAVKWGNDRFVAVGYDLDKSIHSTTGTGTWTAGGSFPAAYPKQYNDLAYSPTLGIWVAVGVTANDKTVISSSNGGVSWTGRTGPTGGAGGYDCVDWSPTLGLFLASGAGVTNKFMTSTNGTSWTALTTASGSAAGGFYALNWSDELGAFLGSNSIGTWKSSDGVNWVQVNTAYVSKYASLSFDTDALSFINAAGITGTDATAINTLVLDLKRANLWTALTAIYPFVGSTSSTQKWNLRYPIDQNDYLRLTFNGGWSHSANGALANGTNAFANTNLGTQSCATSNWACSVYIRNNYTPASAAIDIGAYDENANYGTFIAAQLSVGTARARAWQTAMDFSTTDERGMWLVTSNGTTGSFYLNGNLVASSAQSGSLPNNPTISIGALNRVSGGNAYYSAAEYAFATLGPALTAQQTANLYNIVQKYQTNLGRPV